MAGRSVAEPKSEQGLATLKATVATTSALIVQLRTSVSAAENINPKSVSASSIDALKLAQDSADLIRAHSTKLSLLIINKPFTPSAISTVLRELAAGPLPGLASAVELCNAARYTKAMSGELQWRAKKVFTELGALVEAVPVDGKILGDDIKNGTSSTAGKGSLAATGVIWNSCDAVAELKRLGVAGLVVQKAEGYRDLLKDALEELQEWGDEQPENEDGDEGSADDSDGGDIDASAQDSIDNMFTSQAHIPLEDPDKIRPRLECTLKRLRLIILMYQALVKRRFKTLPPWPPEDNLESDDKSRKGRGIISSLDEAMRALHKIPDVTDELASSFYELDGAEIESKMEECFSTSIAAVELLANNWKGEKDEFTIWADKFKVTIRKDSSSLSN